MSPRRARARAWAMLRNRFRARVGPRIMIRCGFSGAPHGHGGVHLSGGCGGALDPPWPPISDNRPGCVRSRARPAAQGPGPARAGGGPYCSELLGRM